MTHDTTPHLGPNPAGVCMCGCGLPVPMATRNYPERGLVMGHPVRYRPGHRQPWRAFSDRYLVDVSTGCWVWTGRARKGYGQLTLPRKNGAPRMSTAAHRYAYELAYGPVAHDAQLDHLCRNTLCVNPAHLEVVTGTVNVRRGNTVKLNPAAVAYIRWMANRCDPPTDVQLGEHFGVTAANVRAVRLGVTWREIEPLEPPEPLKSLLRTDARGKHAKRRPERLTHV